VLVSKENTSRTPPVVTILYKY